MTSLNNSNHLKTYKQTQLSPVKMRNLRQITNTSSLHNQSVNVNSSSINNGISIHDDDSNTENHVIDISINTQQKYTSQSNESNSIATT
jgi:hypothetical protein